MDEFESLIGHNQPPASEKADLNATLCRVSALPDTICHRQNTGQAWQGTPVTAAIGDTVRVRPGMKILADARPIDFGVPGGGDIAGCRRGIAFQIEQKTRTGSQRDQQRIFQSAWEKAGGIYILARSPSQAVDGVSRIG